MPTARIAFVHAHPDDEAFFAGGAARWYAERGVECVLVTCTDGRYGFDPSGRAGDHPDHDDVATERVRAGELRSAAHELGFSRVVTLGFHDSGMREWPQAASPHAFINADPAVVAGTLGALFDELNARVVVTYDETGFYGHPDHVRAHEVTRRACEIATSPERLYCPVVPESVLDEFVEGAQQLGTSLPAWVLEAGRHVSADSVATRLDVAALASVKQSAMARHVSQVDNGELVGMPGDLFELLFGVEYFQRAWSRASVSEGCDTTDLLGGLTWD